MDLSQKANRVKRDLQTALTKPDSNSVRHAIVAFDAFVDGVVAEILALKKTTASENGTPPETFETPPDYMTDGDRRMVEGDLH
jgi:hypothetical protein